uniref:(California timema) hypothetical protein n=1 Tax=Timema californicum TaxID=61474 RepID=A0A7R9J6Y6_TIMCA|nr:unnamed protein product [Timema californicum]
MTEELEDRPRVSTLLSSLANYSNTIPAPTDPDVKPQPSARMGTLIGVFLPCIQNIFGVILFIRLTWVVGTAGALAGFLIVLLCCCVIVLVSLFLLGTSWGPWRLCWWVSSFWVHRGFRGDYAGESLPSGYIVGSVEIVLVSLYLLGKSWGPWRLCWWVSSFWVHREVRGDCAGESLPSGEDCAGESLCSEYIVMSVEIVLTYMAPSLSIFGDFTKDANIMYNNFRVYGTGVLMLMGTIVFLGVKFVNKFATVALACVLLSILAVYVGIFYNFYGSDKLPMCVLGQRLLKDVDINDCHDDPNGPLFQLFCGGNNSQIEDCEPYFRANNLTVVQGIKGLASGVFLGEYTLGQGEEIWWIQVHPTEILTSISPSSAVELNTTSALANYTTEADNIQNSFLELGQFIARTKDPDDIEPLDRPNYNQVLVDITTSFTILIGIFFPSVTDVRYSSNVLQYSRMRHHRAISVSSQTTNDAMVSWQAPTGRATWQMSLSLKQSAVEMLVTISQVSWQAPTGRATWQMSLSLKQSAVEMLVSWQAPTGRATCQMSLSLKQSGIMAGSNRSGDLADAQKSIPVGTICAILTTSTVYLSTVLLFAGTVDNLLLRDKAEKEWGDGIRGLALSAARYSLLRLEEGPPHTKNWRPQILILSKLTPDLVPKYRKMFAFAAQLKAGKGLTVCGAVIPGDFTRCSGEAMAAKQSLRRTMDEEKVKGFVDVLVARNITDGLNHLIQTSGDIVSHHIVVLNTKVYCIVLYCCSIQTSGLGGMKPNTVLLGWPYGWRQSEDEKTWQVFLQTVRNVSAARMALLVPKGINFFPDSSEKVFTRVLDTVVGNIDVWWIVHDGGLLMLLPFLLKQHRTWKNCKMRIFTVAQMEDNSIQMKKDLKMFLYHLRIEAEVEVVEMVDSDISAYTYERTLMMEQRNQMLRELRLNKKESLGVVQAIVDHHHSSDVKTATKVRFQEPGKEDGDKLGDVTGSKEFDLAIKDEGNVRRMHTAVKLNEVIVNKSHDAQLEMLEKVEYLSLTCKPDMEFLEVLTEGLERVLMVRGGGREVITIYS